MRVLVLGGTTEASALAQALADRDDIDAMLSLAGRTRQPVRPPIPYRVGGFGGIEGLERFLGDHRIDAVVDATHPFAETMARHAEAACRSVEVPLLVLTRPPWTPGPGDRWTEVADAGEAARALGEAPRRVFLTVGRLSLPAFAAAPQHRYLVRSIDPPDEAALLPDLRLLLARGPFDEAGERALMEAERIDVLVTKNSGGGATRAKLDAARALGLPVILVGRPPASGVGQVHEPGAALAWIEALAAGQAPAPERRGV